MGVCCTLSAALGLFISSGLAQDGITAQTISGVTTGLTGTKSISANVTYHVKIAIADYGDAKFDSGVFIKASIECPQ
jgi:hypothetical protein